MRRPGNSRGTQLLYVPPERFEPLASRTGPDIDVPGGIMRGEFFVARDVPVDKLSVTEGIFKSPCVFDDLSDAR
jgi:hypothetical protein